MSKKKDFIGAPLSFLAVLAHAAGFVPASCINLAVPVIVLTWLHVKPLVINMADGLYGLLMVVGCVALLKMDRVSAEVQNIPQFMRVVRFAFVTGLLLPGIVIGVLVMMLVGVYERLAGSARKHLVAQRSK